MIGAILCVLGWLACGLGGLALLNFFIYLEEKEGRSLFFNEDIKELHGPFVLLGPLSILLVLIISAGLKAKEYLSKFKIGG